MSPKDDRSKRDPERRRAEEALRSRNVLLAAQLETALDGILVVDDRGRILSFNHRFIELWDIPPAVIVAKSDELALESVLGKLVAPEEFIRKVHFLYEHPGETSREEIGLKDGRLFDRYSTHVTGPDGKYYGRIWYFRDITEHKRAEEVLRASEAKYRALVETTDTGYLILDREGRVVDANAEYVRLTGRRELSEILGRSVLEWTAEHEKASNAEAVARCIADGGIRIFCLDYATPDGRVTPVEINATVVGEGDALRIISLCRDITERKRAEAEHETLRDRLTEARKMESVGRLAGGVAHDFNNMLAVILGHVDLAIRRAAAGQSLDVNLEEIRRTVERSANLTRQLLAFARKQAVAPVVLDLNAAVAGLLTMLSPLLGENIRLTWRPAPNLRPVRIDPSQIEQILTNLCVNARDAIADVGEITLATGGRTVAGDDPALPAGGIPGEYVWLSVRDTGCGMDPETRARIFEPFFTTKGVGEGTGLGLAMVHGAVEQNGGFIEVAAVPGQGTTFTVHLPRHAGPAGAGEPETGPETARHGHETLLLVEDDPDLLMIATEGLTDLGYRVLPANSPDEAIRLAGRHAGEIRLLLTDVVMPGMNGRHLADSLLVLAPQLKCLFMSGYPSDVIGRHGVLEKGLEFIEKPFSIDGLAAKIRDLLDRG